MVLSSIVSEMKRNIGRNSKTAIFSYPLRLTSRWGESLSEYCHKVLCGKTKMVGPQMEKKNISGYIYLFQYMYVTDGRTPHDGIGHAMHSVARQKPLQYTGLNIQTIVSCSCQACIGWVNFLFLIFLVVFEQCEICGFFPVHRASSLSRYKLSIELVSRYAPVPCNVGRQVKRQKTLA